jgi:hypothetical protein
MAPLKSAKQEATRYESSTLKHHAPVSKRAGRCERVRSERQHALTHGVKDGRGGDFFAAVHGHAENSQRRAIRAPPHF